MITLLANAKINLYLEIIGLRPDGFHELVMVMQSVALSDRITIKRLSGPTIVVNCDHPLVPTDETNLAFRAAALLQERFSQRTNPLGGVEITIDKRIPVGAGLAGGSSNAAAALFGLDMLWNLGLTRIELQELGAELGSDVPFCIAGGSAIATGRGEDVDALHNRLTLHAVLAKYERLSVSTPWAYGAYRKVFEKDYLPLSDLATLEERQGRIHSGPMVKALSAQQPQAIGLHLHNDLEKVVLPEYSEVRDLKAVMSEVCDRIGGLGTMMSGSGPTVFSLAETAEQAEKICDEVRIRLPSSNLKLFAVPTSHHGIEMLSM